MCQVISSSDAASCSCCVGQRSQRWGLVFNLGSILKRQLNTRFVFDIRLILLTDDESVSLFGHGGY